MVAQWHEALSLRRGWWRGVRGTDESRADFLGVLDYQRAVADPLLYHLVINTGLDGGRRRGSAGVIRAVERRSIGRPEKNGLNGPSHFWE